MTALSGALEDLISAYPSTQEFLQQRGKTHTKELNEEEKEELAFFLKNKLKYIEGKAGD